MPIAIAKSINKVTVIGTLTKESNEYKTGSVTVFNLFTMGNEILITGKPGATGADRAVLPRQKQE
jgi:single-stranded DNA-binding protein